MGAVRRDDKAVADHGFVGLPISLRRGQVAGALPGPHRDPYDRMLIAQAVTEISLSSRMNVLSTPMGSGDWGDAGAGCSRHRPYVSGDRPGPNIANREIQGHWTNVNGMEIRKGPKNSHAACVICAFRVAHSGAGKPRPRFEIAKPKGHAVRLRLRSVSVPRIRSSPMIDNLIPKDEAFFI